MAGVAPAAESFAISPDLAYLLTDKGVSTEIQAQLAGTGFSTLRLFALMADERKELRAVLADDPFKLSLDAADLAAGEMIKRRVAVAQLTDAWLAANTQLTDAWMTANVGGESSSRAGRPPANSSSDRFAPYPERNSKKAGGKQKGRGKGKGGKSKDGWHSVTSENRPICYRYNTAGKSCSGQCGKAHCCQIGFGKHPVYEHDVATPAAAGR